VQIEISRTIRPKDGIIGFFWWIISSILSEIRLKCIKYETSGQLARYILLETNCNVKKGDVCPNTNYHGSSNLIDFKLLAIHQR